MDSQQLTWAKRLQAIAQNGLTYTEDQYDIERYEALRVIAVEMMAAEGGVDTSVVQNLFALEAGHATPKVDVRGAVFRDDAILLVRERQDGCWSLPGGWADNGEPPGEAVVREIFEESGYRTRAIKLLALYDRDRHGHPPSHYCVYKIFFHCELLGGTAIESSETDGVGFFRGDALPELSLARVTPVQIARLFEHARHPEWSTDFD